MQLSACRRLRNFELTGSRGQCWPPRSWIAVVPYNFDHFTLAAGLADVRAFHNDSVACPRMHGNPYFPRVTVTTP
jgi:hypothetical protein